MTPKTIETKINRTWKAISDAESIPQQISKSYMNYNSDLPKFYHLVKTHKKSQEMKIRPIVSNLSGPTRKISWLLCKVLNPIYRLLPTHLESSAQLISSISNLDTDTTNVFNFPFSLDVRALYTSIPPQDAVKALRNKLCRHKDVRWALRISGNCSR